MRKEYVYLLVHQDGAAVKIGYSSDPQKRSYSLGQKIDRSKSFQVPVSEGNAHHVEDLLKFWFRHARHEMPFGPGYTEWFNADIIPAVLELLHRERDRFGVEAAEPMQAPMPRPSIDAGEKARRKKERMEKASQAFELRVLAAAENNEATRASLRDLTEEWRQTNAVVRVESRDCRRFGRTLHLHLRGNREQLTRWLEMAGIMFWYSPNIGWIHKPDDLALRPVFGCAAASGEEACIDVLGTGISEDFDAWVEGHLSEVPRVAPV